MFATPTSLLFVSSAHLSTFTLSNLCFRFVPHTTIASKTKVGNIDTFSDVPFLHTCLMLLVANFEGATCMHISEVIRRPRRMPLRRPNWICKVCLDYLQTDWITRSTWIPASIFFFFSFLGKFWGSKEGNKEVYFGDQKDNNWIKRERNRLKWLFRDCQPNDAYRTLTHRPR